MSSTESIEDKNIKADLKEGETLTADGSLKNCGLQKFFWIVCFFMFGISNLLPWFSFLSILVFVGDRFQDAEALQPYQASSVSISSMSGVLIGNLLNVCMLYRFSQSSRILSALVVYLLSFIVFQLVIILQVMNVSFFVSLIFLALLMNIFSPIMLSALFSDAGFYGVNFFSALNTGQAFGGIVVAIIMIPIAIINPPDSVKVIIFLSITIGIVVICLFLYCLMIYSKYYRQKKKEAQAISDNVHSIGQQFNNFWKLFLQKKLTCFSVFFNMAITLMIFPNLLLTVQPSQIPSHMGHLFIVLLVNLIYNLGDFLGRYINRFLNWPKSETFGLLVFTLLRVCFLFLFFFANHKNQWVNFHLDYDFYPMLLSLLLGITNGQVLTTVFATPYTFQSPKDQSDCSILMVLLLGAGLCTGSALSFLFPVK